MTSLALLSVGAIAALIASALYGRATFSLHDSQRGWVDVMRRPRVRWPVRILFLVAIVAIYSGVQIL